MKIFDGVKVKILLLIIFLILIFLLLSFSSPKKYFYQQGIKNIFSLNEGKNILLLGKPGYGYNGGENTDSIILINLRGDRAFLIYIPRDLIVKIDSNLYKINSLFLLNKKSELLREVKKITGLPVNNYIEYDLYLVRNIIDAVGGIDVYLSNSIVDAVSGYALYPGYHHLNGEWAEFVLRSRYAWEGDFFRMKNQFEILKSLKRKIQSLPREDMLKLVKILNANNRHYESSLNSLEFLGFVADIEKINFNKTRKIILGFETKLWADGSFKISTGKEYSGTAYGLAPKEGVGNYFIVQKYIKDEIQKADSQEFEETFEKTKSKIEEGFNFRKRD